MSARSVEFGELLDTLEALNIDFRVDGRTGQCKKSLSFKSFRALGPNGIYFYEQGDLPEADLAGSIFISRDSVPLKGVLSILVSHPQVVYYKLMRALIEPAGGGIGIHSTAIIDSEADIDPDVSIGPYCVIGKCRIGKGASFKSHVVVYDDVIIESDVCIESHSAIGATGVAWVWDPDSGERVVQPQTGGVVISRGCFLGTDITVVRGSVNENTFLGEHSVIAHGSKIGHGAYIGHRAHFANNVSVAGNVNLGDRCFLGSGCIIRPNIKLPSDTVVAAGAVVVKNVDSSGLVLSGVPATSRPAGARMSGVPKSIERGS